MYLQYSCLSSSYFDLLSLIISFRLTSSPEGPIINHYNTTLQKVACFTRNKSLGLGIARTRSDLSVIICKSSVQRAHSIFRFRIIVQLRCIIFQAHPPIVIWKRYRVSLKTKNCKKKSRSKICNLSRSILGYVDFFLICKVHTP